MVTGNMRDHAAAGSKYSGPVRHAAHRLRPLAGTFAVSLSGQYGPVSRLRFHCYQALLRDCIGVTKELLLTVGNRNRPGLAAPGGEQHDHE
jgi:hypothetical protein